MRVIDVSQSIRGYHDLRPALKALSIYYSWHIICFGFIPSFMDRVGLSTLALGDNMKILVGEVSIGDRNLWIVKNVSRLDQLDFVHPRNFQQIIDRMKLSNLYKDQIFWTNDPNIVDCFHPSEVLVITPSGWKCIDQHPKFATWDDEFCPGQMWSLFGENW